MEMKEMEILREELNQLIEQGADFLEIQKVSTKLDECLVRYYKEQLEKGQGLS